MTNLVLLAAAGLRLAAGADGSDVRAVRCADRSVVAALSHTQTVARVVSFDFAAAGLEGYWLAHDEILGYDEGQYVRAYSAVVAPGTTNCVRFLPRAGAKFLPASGDPAVWGAWIRAYRARPPEPPCEHCAAHRRGW